MESVRELITLNGVVRMGGSKRKIFEQRVEGGKETRLLGS
jgi:hypothetical protein